MTTVGEFGEFGAVPSFLSTYKWYLIGAAVIAAAGVGYYYMKKRGGAVAEYDGLDDVTDCGCDS
jgi:hypothetical protein